MFRKRGLPIICDMALVVQRVITAVTAGDLSTNHPKTSDPTTMVLTANYGLGVVKPRDTSDLFAH